MIVSFSVSNFRSFAEEQTLPMVASPALAGPCLELCPLLYRAEIDGVRRLERAKEVVRALRPVPGQYNN